MGSKLERECNIKYKIKHKLENIGTIAGEVHISNAKNHSKKDTTQSEENSITIWCKRSEGTNYKLDHNTNKILKNHECKLTGNFYLPDAIPFIKPSKSMVESKEYKSCLNIIINTIKNIIEEETKHLC